jgi:hypothetical protein
MKNLILISLLALLATGCLSFFILFEGDTIQLKNWWQNMVRDSEKLPFAPYKSRVVSKADIRTKDANELIIVDQNLFWKGSGEKIVPILDKDNTLRGFKVIKGGSGYSTKVKVFVEGASGDQFQIGPVDVKYGRIRSVGVSKTAKWNDEPIVYVKDEKHPFSGIVESQYPGGQIIEQTPFLSGQIHGTQKGWNEYGIPLYSKEYYKGKKHGTHIFWHEKTEDPDDFVPIKSKQGEIYPTLWIKLREDAKKKYGDKFGSHEANEWVTFNYRRRGGDFPVKILEHWKENLMHGLFEGFDQFGNKTFKDEYKMGLRVKHKTFDKTKG